MNEENSNGKNFTHWYLFSSSESLCFSICPHEPPGGSSGAHSSKRSFAWSLKSLEAPWGLVILPWAWVINNLKFVNDICKYSVLCFNFLWLVGFSLGRCLTFVCYFVLQGLIHLINFSSENHAELLPDSWVETAQYCFPGGILINAPSLWSLRTTNFLILQLYLFCGEEGRKLGKGKHSWAMLRYAG